MTTLREGRSLRLRSATWLRAGAVVFEHIGCDCLKLPGLSVVEAQTLAKAIAADPA